jgi:hypothetical protein
MVVLGVLHQHNHVEDQLKLNHPPSIRLTLCIYYYVTTDRSRALGDMTAVRFAGMAAPMITVSCDEPMLQNHQIYTCAPPVFEECSSDISRVVSAGLRGKVVDDPKSVLRCTLWHRWQLLTVWGFFLDCLAVSVGVQFSLSHEAASLPGS